MMAMDPREMMIATKEITVVTVPRAYRAGEVTVVVMA
jgi:hypothetical protein